MEKDQTLEGALSRAKGVFVVPDYGRAVPGSSGKGSTSSSPSSNHRDASHK